MAIAENTDVSAARNMISRGGLASPTQTAKFGQDRTVAEAIERHRYLFSEIGELCRYVDPSDELYNPSKAPYFETLAKAETKALKTVIRRPVRSFADVQLKARYLLEAEGELSSYITDPDDIEDLLRSLVAPQDGRN